MYEVGRAICLWKNHEKGSRTYAEKYKTKKQKVARGDVAPTKGTKNVAEEKSADAKPGSQTEPICKEYDEFVNHIVLTAEVLGKHDLELQPSWHGYKIDPFNITAKRFRRVIKDRMIKDGIVKQSTRVGTYRSLAGVHVDHSVRCEDYLDTGPCRWIEDYFSEGYSVTMKAAISKIILHCQEKFQGPYVPPVYRPERQSALSTKLAFHGSSRLRLVMLAPSDCGEYLDFINKIVRRALHYTYPQTIYEVDFELSAEVFDPQRAEQLVGRLFMRIVKDNILEHTGCPMLGGYDLCPQFEAKRFYRRRKLPSSNAFPRLNASSKESLLRLERFLNANIDSISQKDLIRLYGSDAGPRYDALQAEFLPEIKREVIKDDEHTLDSKIDMPSVLREVEKLDNWKHSGYPLNRKLATSAIAKLSSAVALLRYPPSSISATYALANMSSAIADLQQSCSDGPLGTDQETAWLAAYCECRLTSSDVRASPEAVSYPPEPEMLSPMSEIEFNNVGVLERETEQEPEAEQENELEVSTPKPLDVKAIIENRIKELARKRKLEQGAARGEHQAPKRPHI